MKQLQLEPMLLRATHLVVCHCKGADYFTELGQINGILIVKMKKCLIRIRDNLTEEDEIWVFLTPDYSMWLDAIIFIFVHHYLCLRGHRAICLPTHNYGNVERVGKLQPTEGRAVNIMCIQTNHNLNEPHSNVGFRNRFSCIHVITGVKCSADIM